MYNQKYHQFDTFYNHKFGFHINGPHQQAFETAFDLKPKVIKTLDFSVEVMKEMHQRITDLFLIGRLFVTPQDFGQLGDGYSLARARQRGIEFADKILQLEVNKDIHHINNRPVFQAWESLNEVLPESAAADTHKLYDEYQVAFAEKMQAAGFDVIAMNFGTGNGRGQQWLDLYPGTLETYKFLGFHEYDWPTLDRLHKTGLEGPDEPHNRLPGIGAGRGNDGMWLALRYRRIMNEGIRQTYGDKHVCIITECGMTQGVWGGSANDLGPWATENTVSKAVPEGHLPVPISVDDYWATLLWYNRELMKDDYLLGACLFVTGASGRPEWDTFEHVGPITAKLKAYQQVIDDDPAGPAVPLPPKTARNPYIYGLHDRGGEHLMLVDGQAKGWVLVTEAIGRDPADLSGGDYTDLSEQGLGVLVRLNQAYGESGTIPRQEFYAQFTQRVANYVKASKGAHRWIIGNEMNMPDEQPRQEDSNQPAPITPRDYARCYTMCRAAIHALPGHENDEVIVGAIAVWNNLTPYPADPDGKYAANPLGDWNHYLRDILLALGPDNCDAIAIHAYTHGYQADLVFDEAKMNPPFDNYHFHFRTYRDQLNIIPPAMRHLPVYLTEANGDKEPDGSTWPFGNNGWIKNAYQEINDWNQAGHQPLHCLILFRWQQDPLGWSIDGKQGVQQDFREAIARNYKLTIPLKDGLYALNTDPSHAKGDPTTAELLELGVQSVRFTLKDTSSGPQPDANRLQFYRQKIAELHQAGISSLIILTGETLPGQPSASDSDAAWDSYITQFAARAGQLAESFAPWQPAFQVWNEPDLTAPTPTYDPTLRPAVFGRMLSRCHSAIKTTDPDLTVVTAGLASGNPQWLQQVIDSVGDNLPADIVAIHPYGQRPEPQWPSLEWGFGYVGDLIEGYRQVTTLPQWISEIGLDTRDNQFQAEYLRRFYQAIVDQFKDVVGRVYWFCYSDGMVAPFGLLAADGQRKPAYSAFRDVASAPPPPPPVKTYAVEYVSHNTPSTLIAGQTTTVQLTLRNTSNWTWPASGDFPVRLGYHWYTPDGQDVPATLWADIRTVLPADLPPGQSVTLNAELAAPRTLGSFEVRWDMVEELQTWFNWQQVPTLNIPLEVTDTPPGPPAWRVSASHNSVSTGTDNLLQAIDGNPATRWSSFAPQQPGMWFEIDLGAVKTISRLRLDNAGSSLDYPRGYRVELSIDHNNWLTVAEEAQNNQPLNVSFAPQQARYVRIVQTGTAPWWSIHQIEIDSEETTISARASHHNVQSGVDNILQAFDGKANTRWSSQTVQKPDMWFEIDLNRIQTITGLILDTAGSPNDYPRGYVLSVSRDRQQWTEVTRNPDNLRALDLDFPFQVARYIRVTLTRDHEYWWSVHEVKIKGSSGELRAKASHNNVLAGPDNLTNALDGQTNTRWSSGAAQQPGMWFEIDLGRIRTLKGLVLDSNQSPQDYPRGYTVFASADYEGWQEVASQPNNDRPVDIDFEPLSARYIRVVQTGQTAWWWSIHRVGVK